jgi:hypothetical protein
MEGFDDTPELPEGALPAPASVEGGAPAAEAPEAEYISLKNRGEEARMTRATAQAAADELGIPIDEFVKRNQIGWDGTRLYNEFEEWRSQQMAEIEAERRRSRADGGGARTPHPVASVPAGPAPVARQRPNPQDVVGTVNWLADKIEAIEASGGKAPPELSEKLDSLMERIEAKEQAAERLEERGYANQCYEEVKSEWKKEYGKMGIDPPSQREMWQYLRRMPLHEDPDRTWQEIWRDIAWALKGPAVARAARRQATADLTKPDARVLVPAGNRAGGPSPKAPSTGNEDQDIAAMEQALSGVSASVLLPGIRD